MSYCNHTVAIYTKREIPGHGVVLFHRPQWDFWHHFGYSRNVSLIGSYRHWAFISLLSGCPGNDVVSTGLMLQDGWKLWFPVQFGWFAVCFHLHHLAYKNLHFFGEAYCSPLWRIVSQPSEEENPVHEHLVANWVDCGKEAVSVLFRIGY